MTEAVQQILDDLEYRLKGVYLEIDDAIKKAQASIELCVKANTRLKEYIVKYKFRSHADEIRFFREIKPLLVSKLIYYTAVYKTETRKPNGSDKVRKKYLLGELNKLKNFFDDNLDFYRYYRSGYHYLDHKYFLRGRHDISLTPDSYFFEADPRFSTSHDFKVAEILANDLLQVYLEDELRKIERKDSIAHTQEISGKKLLWTEQKTALTELVYALHARGVFENGKADINRIARYFEQVFNVDLGDYYRTFIEIRFRKTGRTKFLDILRSSLQQRMDEADER